MAPRTRGSTDHAESSSTETTTTTATIKRTRRHHRKSRNGCLECKNRHIRCDERQPSCANCEAAERTCFYPPPKVQAGKQSQKKRQQQRAKVQQPEATARSSSRSGLRSQGHVDIALNANANAEQEDVPALALRQRNNHLELEQGQDDAPHMSPLPPSTVPSIIGLDAHLLQPFSSASLLPLGDIHGLPAACLPGLSSIPDAESQAVFTPQHMMLLRYADRVPNFTAPDRSAVDIAVRRAAEAPYLIDEILAFTAFDMAYFYPGTGVHLRHLAAELQNRALASFTRLSNTVPYDDEPTAVPRFLFSAILGRHILADTLAHHCSDFHTFIDRFVACLNLNRGIRAVTPPARDFLVNSELQPFLSNIIEAQKKIATPGTECGPLSRLMENSDLSEARAIACHQAIHLLQNCFDICRNLEEEEYPQAAARFSVMLEAGFAEMLRKHQPEALVILAYYGVLLHRCRTFWPFGNTGASIIRAVAEHVGSYWQETLAWPFHVLQTEQHMSSLTPSSYHS